MAASFFAPSRMVAVVGEDFPESYTTLLQSRGIDLSGLTRQKGRTFRWKGRYAQNLNDRETLDTQLNVFEDFQPTLPSAWISSRYIFLGNIDPQLQSSVLDQVNSPVLVAADTMNFWINGKAELLSHTLRRVNLLFVNDSEALELAKEQNIVRAAKKISAMGPKWIVIKRGEYGAMLFLEDQIFTIPAFPLASVFDPTGAGDSFAGGFMGYLALAKEINERNLRQALVVGSVMASFVVEDFSLDRLQTVNDLQIRERFRAFKNLTHFDDLSLDLLRVAS
jgi:sugar/nucleoside kinase (ribokinase family)